MTKCLISGKTKPMEPNSLLVVLISPFSNSASLLSPLFGVASKGLVMDLLPVKQVGCSYSGCSHLHDPQLCFLVWPVPPSPSEQHPPRFLYRAKCSDAPVKANTTAMAAKAVTYVENPGILYQPLVQATGRYLFFRFVCQRHSS